jgi:hypothetical protein
MAETLKQQWDKCSNGPYLVLSDASTFDGVDGCFVAYISDKAEEELEACSDFKAVEEGEAVDIPLEDLIDAYNKVHGTNL